MRRFTIFALVLFTSIGAMAEGRKQLFGGYQFTSVGSGDSRVNVAKGWDADFEYKIGNGIGIVADGSGANKDGAKIHTIMAGPRLSTSAGRIRPFAEALFGMAVLSSRGNNSAKTSVAFGGGIDYKLSRNFAVRLAKVDYNIIRLDGGNMKNIRLATGVVLKF